MACRFNTAIRCEALADKKWADLPESVHFSSALRDAVKLALVATFVRAEAWQTC